ncbi:hypothetical protein C8J43_10898 [Sphingomonas sp. PP-CE-1G-424]|nr:hypothetical protein C8J43_10898 [Sphingomonas sp. PP-CE-1G-424]
MPAKAKGNRISVITNGCAWLGYFVRVGVLAIAASIVPAVAQTQAQQDRIDRVSRFAVTSSICGRLGMTVDPRLGDKVEEAFNAEASSWSLGRDTFERLKQASIDRAVKSSAIDLETASANAKTEAELRRLRTMFVAYGRMCVEATTDPIFSRLITAPAGFDPQTAATAFADSMLEGGGLASWQTPAIRARGDMMMSAGTCRKRIGKDRSDALAARFGRSEEARTREYYLKSFDIGLNDTEMNFTLAQCNRLISRNRLEIEKVGTK